MSQFLNSLAEIEVNRSKNGVGAALASVSVEPHCVLPPPLRVSDGPPQIEMERAESVGLDEIGALLWQRRRTFLCFVTAGLLAAGLATALRKPIYRARTAVRLESPADAYPKLSETSPLFPVGSTVAGESYVQNELKILQSDSLAIRVAKQLEPEGERVSSDQTSSSPLIKLLTFFDRKRGTPSADELRVKAIQRALTVRPSLKSQVVEIYFDSNDPARAARGANAVVAEYVGMNREAQLASARNTTEWLSSQISDLKTKLDKENEQLKAFADASGLLYSANQSVLTEQRVSEIQEQLTKAETERAARQALYETALSSPPESLPDGAENSLLREYESNLVTAEKDLIQLRSMYTPEHYKVIDAESRVAQLQSSIQRERQNVIQRMRAGYDSAERLQQSIAGNYRSQTRRLESQSDDAFRYSVLKHELDSTQQLYDSLLQEEKEARVASTLHATNIRLIDTARPPATPYSPNLPLNGAIGLGSGLVLGLVTILVQGHGSIPAQVRTQSRAMNIRELGAIPKASNDPLLSSGRYKALSSKGETAAIELVTWHTQSLLTESYRSAITSILFSPGFRQHRVLAITSIEPKEGKTTVVTNLAVALAETSGRVLLIDGDLRRPGLHKIFERCNDTGLTTLLNGDQSIATLKFEELAKPTKVPGLFLLSSGPGSASVSPLLHSVRIAQFMERARQEFDCVLIDTPPVSLFSDARLIGKLSDAVILVFDAEKANRNEMNATCLQFQDDGTNVLGTIRNRSDKSLRRSSYGYYQSYVQD